MNNLVVRKLPFDFDGVPFNWHPDNAPFAMMKNAVTFQLLGLEAHTGLPPTCMHVGAIDLFHVEALDYAQRLTRAGVAVELHVWAGAFDAFGADHAHVSREARRVARSAIKRALQQGGQ